MSILYIRDDDHLTASRDDLRPFLLYILLLTTTAVVYFDGTHLVPPQYLHEFYKNIAYYLSIHLVPLNQALLSVYVISSSPLPSPSSFFRLHATCSNSRGRFFLFEGKIATISCITSDLGILAYCIIRELSENTEGWSSLRRKAAVIVAV